MGRDAHSNRFCRPRRTFPTVAFLQFQPAVPYRCYAAIAPWLGSSFAFGGTYAAGSCLPVPCQLFVYAWPCITALLAVPRFCFQPVPALIRVPGFSNLYTPFSQRCIPSPFILGSFGSTSAACNSYGFLNSLFPYPATLLLPVPHATMPVNLQERTKPVNRTVCGRDGHCYGSALWPTDPAALPSAGFPGLLVRWLATAFLLQAAGSTYRWLADFFAFPPDNLTTAAARDTPQHRHPPTLPIAYYSCRLPSTISGLQFYYPVDVLAGHSYYCLWTNSSYLPALRRCNASIG